MNVVFDDDYTLYLTGMEWLLMDLFGCTEDICFSEMDRDSITRADIIIKSFSAGERFLCQPVLKMRQRGSLVIGIYDGSVAPTCNELPLCFSNTVFINRSESLEKIKELVSLGMQRSQQETQHPSKQNCLVCKHQTLTLQQAGVATRFYLGEETHTIARKMKISAKTVSSHKYVIMKKFNLGSDQDLLTFLNLLKSQLISPNIFKEYLNLCC